MTSSTDSPRSDLTEPARRQPTWALDDLDAVACRLRDSGYGGPAFANTIDKATAALRAALAAPSVPPGPAVSESAAADVRHDYVIRWKADGRYLSRRNRDLYRESTWQAWKGLSVATGFQSEVEARIYAIERGIKVDVRESHLHNERLVSLGEDDVEVLRRRHTVALAAALDAGQAPEQPPCPQCGGPQRTHPDGTAWCPGDAGQASPEPAPERSDQPDRMWSIGPGWDPEEDEVHPWSANVFHWPAWPEDPSIEPEHWTWEVIAPDGTVPLDGHATTDPSPLLKRLVNDLIWTNAQPPAPLAVEEPEPSRLAESIHDPAMWAKAGREEPETPGEAGEEGR